MEPQKSHWYALLGSRFASPRPELLVSLSVEEDVPRQQAAAAIGETIHDTMPILPHLKGIYWYVGGRDVSVYREDSIVYVYWCC